MENISNNSGEWFLICVLVFFAKIGFFMILFKVFMPTFEIFFVGSHSFFGGGEWDVVVCLLLIIVLYYIL